MAQALKCPTCGHSLGKRAESIIQFITEYRTERTGMSPSIAEIMTGVGLKSTAATQYHLDRLKAVGRITWEPGKVRTIRLVETAA